GCRKVLELGERLVQQIPAGGGGERSLVVLAEGDAGVAEGEIAVQAGAPALAPVVLVVVLAGDERAQRTQPAARALTVEARRPAPAGRLDPPHRAARPE